MMEIVETLPDILIDMILCTSGIFTCSEDIIGDGRLILDIEKCFGKEVPKTVIIILDCDLIFITKILPTFGGSTILVRNISGMKNFDLEIGPLHITAHPEDILCNSA